MMKVLILASNSEELRLFRQTQAALTRFKIDGVVKKPKKGSDLRALLHQPIYGAVIVSSLAKEVSSRTLLPVIAVPRSKSELMSISAIPGVGMVAVDGFWNAGLLSIQILGCKSPKLLNMVKKYKADLRKEVIAKGKKIK